MIGKIYNLFSLFYRNNLFFNKNLIFFFDVCEKKFWTVRINRKRNIIGNKSLKGIL
jgi:hypothetical protein